MSSKPKQTADQTVLTVPVSEFQYRQMVPSLMPPPPPVKEEPRETEFRFTESTLTMKLEAERTRAIAETETRLRKEFAEKAAVEATRISRAIEDFGQARKDYFSRVEAEVVHLALAIAAKILHREAQVDPILVAAIVQIALGQLKEGACATIRVRPENMSRWREHFASAGLNLEISVIEDDGLDPADCILETEMGSVNFSLDMQLKEVERGFFDVLAQKPKN